MTKAFLFLLIATVSATSAVASECYFPVPTVSNDPFDTTRGTIVTGSTPGASAPSNTFYVPPDGCDLSETFMPDVGFGGIGYIEFLTSSNVTIGGARVFAANDAPGVPYRRAMSRFRLMADLDNNGSYETVVVDTTIDPDYSAQPGNLGPRQDILDLPLLNLGGTNVTAQRWRLEVTQGSQIGTYDGVRIIEVDALPPLFVVTNAADSGPGSLRQTVADALPDSTINFAPPLSGQTILLTSGQIVLDKDLTIDASALPGGITIDGNASSRVVRVDGGATVTLRQLNMANGVASVGPLAGYGACIFNSGTLTLRDCAITGGSAHAGGAIYNGLLGSAVLKLVNSTLSGNTANFGGALHNEANTYATNSTFSGNSGWIEGGAISAPFGRPVVLVHCTLTGNTAGQGGGIRISSGGTTIQNTIVAGNSATTDPDIHGSFVAVGVNLTNGDPVLAPLGDYGGPTPTQPPLPGSPAIDAGSDAAAAGLATDQRGLPRLSVAHVDIGAVESLTPLLTVTTTADSGTGSLREAIAAANLNPGPDRIEFNIPGPGPHEIYPIADLPPITEAVEIDATTQPGYAGTPLVMVHGVTFFAPPFAPAEFYFVGLVVRASGTVIRGLAVNGFSHGIWLDQPGGAVVEGCFLGVEPMGAYADGNYDSGLVISSPGNVVGGPNAGARNLISGNDVCGILLTGESAISNVIQGNWIGSDVTGSYILPQYYEGIPCGVRLEYGAAFNQLGGAGLLARNLITSFGGIGVWCVNASSNRIQGNYIGTDVTGTLSIQPQMGTSYSVGIQMEYADENLIGGREAGEGNLISGNSEGGLRLYDGSDGNSILGNFIGTDVSGMAALENGYHGIYVSALEADTGSNLIGDELPGGGNVISANGGAGISLEGLAIGNQIVGNRIGTSADGSTVLGNGGGGIVLYELVPGIIFDFNPVENTIRRNSIFGNFGLGIDLGGNGVTANDVHDADLGPNESQNFPVITSASVYGSAVIIIGSLATTAVAGDYDIEFFSSPSADLSGYGEGKHYLGDTQITTSPGGNGTFVVVLSVPGEPAHWITATATDPYGNTSEFSLAVLAQPGTPPVITEHPANVSAPPGANIALCVAAMGSEPLSYQWRQNGVNVPGATNPCLTLLGAQAEDGGTYDVVVFNPFEVVLSSPATVVIELPVLPPGDNLADRVPLLTPVGAVRGSNLNATREPGEPNHVGKPGGASVWYSFTSPYSGIMSLNTSGSSFDTLLAVYTGTTFPALVEVAGDEERGGGLTSQLKFNVQAGVEYVIVIDGFGGAMGGFALSWSFELTAELYPVIVLQPESVTVAPGASHTFVANATGSGLTYQWSFNGMILPGAVSPSLTVSNVQESSVGVYTLRVTQGSRWIETRSVSLQINLTGAEVQSVQATDKFLDASYSPTPLVLGTATEPGGYSSASVVRGYTGTQVFNTFGAAGEPGEPPVCSMPGGASSWIKFVALESGELHLNTDGSSYDTAMEVYERIPGVANLHYLGCDQDSGLDMLDSKVIVPVVAGRTNFIVVDGRNGTTGVLKLNYNLVVPSTLTALGPNESGQYQFLITGRPGMAFAIQITSDFVNWIDLFSGSDADGSFLYTDTTNPRPGGRFYRLLMRP